jgi:WD40 repeat protein
MAKHGLVDHRTDVYSLGVTLYEVLTGIPAVGGNDREQILNAITLDEPRPPRALDAAIPHDLETIVLKALEKSAADRYDSAQALAEDLQRFLDDKPIRARRPSAVQRVKKWSRQHGPAILAGMIVLATTLGLLATGSLLLWIKEKEKNEALGLAERALQEKDESEGRLRERLYAGDIKLAFQEWQKGNLLVTLERLERHRPVGDQEDLRGFEWYYLNKLCHCDLHTLRGHEGGAYGVAFSHDGRLVATCGKDGYIRIWATDTGLLQKKIPAHDDDVNGVAFSPDDTLLFSASDDGTTKIWEFASGKPVRTIHNPGERVVGVGFAPSGEMLAVSLQENHIKVWDVDAPKTYTKLDFPPDRLMTIGLSWDAKTIAAGGFDGTIRLWDRSTGRSKPTLTGHSKRIMELAFSHDNRKLASACLDGTVRVWNVDNGKVIYTIPAAHRNGVARVVFSLDDRFLATGGNDNCIRQWYVQDGSFNKVIRGHTGSIYALQYASDGRTLASASNDGTVKLWNWGYDQEWQGFYEIGPDFWSIAFSPDGRTLATGKNDGSIQLRDAITGKARTPPLATKGSRVSRVLFGRNGILAARSSDGLTQIWESFNEKKLLTFAGERAQPAVFALSRDGRILATARGDAIIRLRDSATGQDLGDMPTKQGDGAQLFALAFSPDGRKLASGNSEGHVWLWDVEKREVVDELRGLREMPKLLAYSPNGRYLAGAGFGGNLAIWDLESRGKPHFNSYKQELQDIAFSPDSKTLATVCDDDVLLWNVATGQEMMRLDKFYATNNHALAFSGWADPGGCRRPDYHRRLDILACTAGPGDDEVR